LQKFVLLFSGIDGVTMVNLYEICHQTHIKK